MFATTSGYSKYYEQYDLPPLTAKRNVKKKKVWKMAVLDSFERIAIDQFHENLQFVDLYRMIEGKLTYQELSEVAPHLENIQSALDGVGIPSFLRHYDIIGVILDGLTGILLQMTDKFHVTDHGEIPTNEFLRQQGKELAKMLENVLETSVQLALAENGFDKDMNEFSSEEEKQAYIQKLEEARAKFTPKDTFAASKKTFKSIGQQWGEATMEQDMQRFDIPYLDKENFKDYWITGKCFRHFRIGLDDYSPEFWSAKSVFHSKEVDAKLVHKGEYVGNLGFSTPAQIIRKHGHLIDTKTQKELLGGNDDWSVFVGDDGYAGSIETALKSNFNKQDRVPFSGYHDYNFYLALQEETGIPLGTQTLFEDDGTATEHDRFLPRLAGHQRNSVFDGYASILRDDFKHRTDLCQEMECYFRAYDLYGYLTYPDEYGTMVTEEVTEDILPEFLKENKIKTKFTESIVDIIEDFEPNTLKWVYRPVIYKGIKIQSPNLSKPIYLQCEEYEHQIKGDSEFDRFLPVTGFIGESQAKKVEPYQAQHNLSMNQVYNLTEKELGVFFAMDVGMIPSEYEGWGDTQEAFMAMRNVAKDTGVMPMASSSDAQGVRSPHNNIASYNLSNSSQIADRIKLAEFTQRKGYEVIGISQSLLQQPTKYETAEGVRQNQEAGWAQLAELYGDFNLFVKASREVHLSVAQYAQSNKKDNSLYYTKSDGSIEFLKFQDPEFPLRRIGLLATADSGKRKELETFKSLIINNNTLGSDTLELAKLISSDGMAQAVEIAKSAQESTRAREDQQANQQAQLQERAIQAEIESKAKIAAELEASKDRDRVTKVQVAEINALGRASDKKSDAKGIQEIKSAADQAMAKQKIAADNKIADDKLRIEEKKTDDASKLKLQEFKIRAKELEEKSAQRKSNEFIATINKN